MLNKFFKYIFILIFISSCKITKQRLPYFDSYDFSPKWNYVDHKIPKFQLINQNGDTITNDDYAGKFILPIFSLQPALEFVQNLPKI